MCVCVFVYIAFYLCQFIPLYKLCINVKLFFFVATKNKHLCSQRNCYDVSDCCVRASSKRKNYEKKNNNVRILIISKRRPINIIRFLCGFRNRWWQTWIYFLLSRFWSKIINNRAIELICACSQHTFQHEQSLAKIIMMYVSSESINSYTLEDFAAAVLFNVIRLSLWKCSKNAQ